MREEHNAAQRELAKRQVRIDSLVDAEKHYKSELERWRGDHGQVSDEHERLRIEQNKLQEEIRNLTKDKKSAQTQLTTHQSQISNLILAEKRHQDELEKWRSQHSHLKEEHGKLSEEAQKHKAAHSDAQDTLQKWQNAHDAVHGEYGKLSIQHSQLQAELRVTLQEHHMSQQQLIKHQEEAERWRREHSDLVRTTQGGSQELWEVQQELDRCRKDIERLQKERAALMRKRCLRCFEPTKSDEPEVDSPASVTQIGRMPATTLPSSQPRRYSDAVVQPSLSGLSALRRSSNRSDMSAACGPEHPERPRAQKSLAEAEVDMASETNEYDMTAFDSISMSTVATRARARPPLNTMPFEPRTSLQSVSTALEIEMNSDRSEESLDGQASHR